MMVVIVSGLASSLQLLVCTKLTVGLTLTLNPEPLNQKPEPKP